MTGVMTSWDEMLGCNVIVDEVGNMFAIRPDRLTRRRPIQSDGSKPPKSSGVISAECVRLARLTGDQALIEEAERAAVMLPV